MKKSILLFFSLLMFLSNYSQNSYKQSLGNWCGTDAVELEQWRMANAYIQNTSKNQGADNYIPLKFHIFGTNSLTGFYSRSGILDLVCYLNAQFVPVGFTFYISGNDSFITKDAQYGHDDGLEFIGKDYYYIYPDKNRVMDFNLYNQDGVYNVYIVKDIPGLCGRSSMSPRNGGIELIQGCMFTGNTTFAHESGHWFGLPHTFVGWEDGNFTSGTPGNCTANYPGLCSPATLACWPSNVENVARNNCLIAGDKFCDTDADYYWDRWGSDPACSQPCNTWKDPSGTLIHPDSSLYMSYADDHCTSRFSPNQINDPNLGMIHFLNTSRSYLLNHPIPPVRDTITSTPTQINPTSAPYNYVEFKWNAVKNASIYHLLVNRSSSFSTSSSNVIADIFVFDTIFGTALLQTDSSKTIYWKVKAFNPVYTCGNYSSPKNFKVGGYQFGAGIANSDFSSSLQIYPNPISENEFHLVGISNKTMTLKGLIYNTSGQLVQQQNISITAGQNDKTIILSKEISTGVYFFHLISENESFIHKLVVLK